MEFLVDFNGDTFHSYSILYVGDEYKGSGIAPLVVTVLGADK